MNFFYCQELQRSVLQEILYFKVWKRPSYQVGMDILKPYILAAFL